MAGVLGLLAALVASLLSSASLDIVSRLVLGLIGAAGALLVITRARVIIGRRRYDMQREVQQFGFPGCEPRGWEVLPIVIAYGVGLWLFSRA